MICIHDILSAGKLQEIQATKKPGKAKTLFPVIFDKFLLLGQILSHIERAGSQNNGALDDVLQSRIDVEHVQRNEDHTQNKHAENDSADLAGAADKRYTADDTGCNGVALGVDAGGRGDGAVQLGLDYCCD